MTSNKQIRMLTRKIVKHKECFKVLSTEDAQAAILNVSNFIACACEAWKNRSVIETDVEAQQPIQVIQSVQTNDEKFADWCRFYKEFGFIENEEDLKPALPAEKSGFSWLIVIPKGLTMNKVLQVMRTKMDVSSYVGDDLDTNVPTNDRVADNDYVVCVRDRIEADEELKNRSANRLSDENVKGITLLERLVLGFFYFWKVGPQEDINKSHLDVENSTLCSGSRGSGGGVPSVNWSPDYRKVYIRWYPPGDSNGYLRARAVQ